MNNTPTLDQVCDELLGGYQQRARLEKTAHIHRSASMPSPTVLRKVASEIRHLSTPVEVTYEDINSFISEVVYER